MVLTAPEADEKLTLLVRKDAPARGRAMGIVDAVAFKHASNQLLTTKHPPRDEAAVELLGALSTIRSFLMGGPAFLTRPPTLRRCAGFNLIELLVSVAVLSIAALLGLPALENSIQRNKIIGTAHQTTALLHLARVTAIRHTVPATVRADFATDRILAFRDPNRNGIQDDPATEPIIGSETGFVLPLGVVFQAPGEGPEGENAVVEFEENSGGGWITFESDGSVAKTGGLRLADPAHNHLEIRVGPQATGRVSLRKWDGVAWREPGDGTWAWN
jgi:prepilin-type N-terminal cleavage/methylation domain-containing protein